MVKHDIFIPFQACLPENQIRQLCMVAREVFLQQPMLLELEAPVHIVGDIHGQFSDLLRHFDKIGYPPDANYLFLGDYVDRGRESIETICLLLAYKIKYPENFFLLRGNHECAGLNRFEIRIRCHARFPGIVNATFILLSGSTDFTTSASGNTASNCGRLSSTSSTVCPSVSHHFIPRISVRDFAD